MNAIRAGGSSSLLNSIFTAVTSFPWSSSSSLSGATSKCFGDGAVIAHDHPAGFTVRFIRQSALSTSETPKLPHFCQKTRIFDEKRGLSLQKRKKCRFFSKNDLINALFDDILCKLHWWRWDNSIFMIEAVLLTTARWNGVFIRDATMKIAHSAWLPASTTTAGNRPHRLRVQQDVRKTQKMIARSWEGTRVWQGEPGYWVRSAKRKRSRTRTKANW